MERASRCVGPPSDGFLAQLNFSCSCLEFNGDVLGDGLCGFGQFVFS